MLRVQKLKTMIAEMQPTDINNFKMVRLSGVTISGEVIVSLMRDYDERYTAESSLLSAWNKYRYDTEVNFWRAFDALNAEYNPINNYDMQETETAEQHDGNKTNTRSTADGHKTVTTSTQVDNNVKVTASGTNNPTTKHYTTTFEDDSAGRLASYDVNTGETETRTTADPTKNNSTVTDDLTVVNTEKHTPVTATVNNVEITADMINGRTLVRSGNIGVTSSQQLITAEIALRTVEILKNYIERFIDRYTYFVGGVDIVYADYTI